MADKAELITKLDALNAKAHEGGGKERIDKQHAAGKLTARERVDLPARSRKLRRNRPLRHPPLR
jgi:acetyl-CoA carboxylase carboxyltransferase component